MKHAFKIENWIYSLNLSELTLPEREVPNFRKTIKTKNRLTRWKKTAELNGENFFSKVLDTYSFNELQLCHLFQKRKSDYRHEIKPDWIIQFEEIYSKGVTTDIFPDVDKLHNITDGLLYLVEPILSATKEYFGELLIHEINRDKGLPIKIPIFIDELLNIYKQDLYNKIYKTLLLDFYIYKLKKETKEKHKDRNLFNEYILKLRKSDFQQKIFNEYPVLARLIWNSVHYLRLFHTDLIERFSRDWKEIAKVFDFHEPYAYVNKVIVAGDKHENNQSVLLLSFSDNRRLVYKPTNIGLLTTFQTTIDWLESNNFSIHHKKIRSINKGNYGWIEFIKNETCYRKAQIKKYYERMGSLLALTHLMSVTDLHSENIIAHGEFPVIVDYESFFQPDLPDSDSASSFNRIFNQNILNSILKTNLLSIDKNTVSEDTGILGSRKEEVTSRLLYENEELFVRKNTEQNFRINNRPKINGTEVNPLDYSKYVKNGFKLTYEFAIKNRKALLQHINLNYSKTVNRVILRHTAALSILLNQSYHPDFMRDAIERDLFFGNLWYGISNQKYMGKIIAEEIRALWNGDIVKINSQIDSLDIKTNNATFKSFLKRSGLDTASDLINSLTQGSLDKQYWFIDTSFALADKRRSAVDSSFTTVKNHGSRPLDDKDVLEIILKIAQLIKDLSFEENAEPNIIGWVGFDPELVEFYPVTPLFYEGMLGISFFYHQLYKITGELQYYNFGKKAFDFSLKQLLNDNNENTALGFNGWGGVLLAISYMYEYNDNAQIELKAPFWKLIEQEILKEKEMDFMNGISGCLYGLLKYEEKIGDKGKLKHLIKLCLEKIIVAAVQIDDGIAWHTAAEFEKPLLGFAHGTTGIAWSLLEYYQHSKDYLIKELILKAMIYEDAHFSPSIDDWPDLRNLQKIHPEYPLGTTYSTVSWCHGAPGIGLLRAKAFRIFPEENFLKKDLNKCIEITINKGLNVNTNCLCHGDVGNFTLLQYASRYGLLPESVDISDCKKSIWQKISNNGLICGNGFNIVVPGLMTGLAGIGYGLLRMLAPDKSTPLF